MAFFPGTKGDKGDTGAASTVPGPAGPAGGLGPIGVYTGTYNQASVYYDTDVRKDIVDYAGQFWVVGNPEKSGTSNWDAPNMDDWVPFGTSLINVATALKLLVPADIAVGLNLTGPAYFKSNNFVQNTTGQGVGWLLSAAGYWEANDQNNKFRGLISTNSPRFNFESITRTMPSVGYSEFVIPAIVDADIPVNPIVSNVTDDILIFSGWMQGPNNYLEARFGNTAQKFLINLQGIGQNISSGSDFFYIQLYYRLRDSGGAWDPWVKIGEDVYMQKLAGLDQSFQNTQTLSVTLAGTNDIQFSAGFSKGSGGGAEASVGGARISIEAYN